MKPKTYNKTNGNSSDKKTTVSAEAISEIIEIMHKIDLNSLKAKANIDSFSDNNGKRIFL